MKITRKAESGVTPRGVHRRPDERIQIQFRFNLNIRKDDEAMLADDCARAQHERSFKPMLVSALKLFLDLKAGYTHALLHYFPEVVRAIENAATSAEIEALRREIAELKAQGYAANSSAQKPLEAQRGADFGVKIKQADTGNYSLNFQQSIGGFFE